MCYHQVSVSNVVFFFYLADLFLDTICNIHKYKLYHGYLYLKSSYVFVKGKLKIVKIERSLPQSCMSDLEFQMNEDFKDFKGLLVNLIEPQILDWEEHNNFFECFDDLNRLS